MKNNFYLRIKKNINLLKKKGTYKIFKYIQSPMSSHAEIEGIGSIIVLCSNNYLGLADKVEIVQAGISALKKYGAGAASARFICGTFDIHRELEKKIAEFVHTESALTYTSCLDVNMSVIPAVLESGDTVISDELNHASIIDGCRLINKGVKKFVYSHVDLNSLEEKLKEAGEDGNKLIITDGVFSMEGDIAPLPGIIELGKKYNAIIMIDDSHAIGVIGKTGRGTTEYYDLLGKVDIITGTFGKALGGAGGGFVAAKKEVIDICIQKSRSHLFSTSIPPVLTAIGISAIEYLRTHPQIMDSLHKKIKYFRNKLKNNGFDILEGDSAIIPIMVGDASTAINIASEMLKKGVYVVGFGYPVVPKSKARVRIQVSDALNYKDIDYAVDALSNIFGSYLK